MNEYRWVRLTPCDNIPPREGREVVVGGRHIAVFNLGGRFFATDNRCPHKGGPLCDGIITGAAVVCPLHAWSQPRDGSRRTARSRRRLGVSRSRRGSVILPAARNSKQDAGTTAARRARKVHEAA